jgi:hypothetical protein
LLGLAKAKMPPDQFARVSTAIPGTDALIGQATRSGLPTTGLTGPSSLNGVLEKAGISPAQEAQMIPVVENAISKSAGPSVGQAFVSAVK